MRQRNDDNVLHHCAVLWNICAYGSSGAQGVHGGFLIPRQICAPVAARLREAIPNLTFEEAMSMAIAPRLLLVDLGYVAKPESPNDGRGLSEQQNATLHPLWPSYSKEGQALATFQLTLRPDYDADKDEIERVGREARARIRSHVAQVFKRGFKISEEHASWLCAGRSDLREGFAKTCEDLGLAAELERDLPAAPSAPRSRL